MSIERLWCDACGCRFTVEDNVAEVCPVCKTPDRALHPQPVLAQEMTLRDRFAGQALVGLLAAKPSPMLHGLIADAAYKIADVMMVRRAEE